MYTRRQIVKQHWKHWVYRAYVTAHLRGLIRTTRKQRLDFAAWLDSV